MNKFKRALRLSLAFAMVLSVLTVMNVYTAMAFTVTDYDVYWDLSSPSTFDSTFTASTTNTATNTKDGVSYVLKYVADSKDSIDSTDGLKMNGNSNTSLSRRYFTVDVPAGASVTISAKAQSSADVLTYKWGTGSTASSTVSTSTTAFTDITVQNSTVSTSTLTFGFGTNKQYVKYVGISLTGSESGGGETGGETESSTETTTEAVTVNFVDTLSADDVSTATYSKNTAVGNGESKYFKIIATPSNTVDVDTNNKKFTTADGVSHSSTNRIKTGGKGDTAYRAIKFTTSAGTESGKIYAYCISSSSSSGNERTLNLLNANNEVVKSSDTGAVSTSAVTEISFEIEPGTTYYLVSASGGINFYYIGSTIDLEDLSQEAETDYFYAYFTSEEVASADSYSIYKADSDGVATGDKIADDNNETDFTVVYTGVDLNGDNKEDVKSTTDGGYIVAFVVENLPSGTDAQDAFVRVLNTTTTTTE